MKLIFISGPYRGKTKADIARNIRAARAAAIEFWRAGYGVFCPHLNSAHMDGIAEDRAFLDFDLRILEVCDILYLLPGWETSAGARIERKEAAKLGKEIWEFPVP
jgi:hypothetical protein